jgi:hypothetical protein
MRQENNGVRYFSFQEIPGIPKQERPTYGPKKKEKFLGICRICKEPLSYIGDTNVVVCTNEKCRGYKNENKEDESEWSPIFRLLDDKGLNKALTLFSEDE